MINVVKAFKIAGLKFAGMTAAGMGIAFGTMAVIAAAGMSGMFGADPLEGSSLQMRLGYMAVTAFGLSVLTYYSAKASLASFRAIRKINATENPPVLQP